MRRQIEEMAQRKRVEVGVAGQEIDNVRIGRHGWSGDHEENRNRKNQDTHGKQNPGTEKTLFARGATGRRCVFLGKPDSREQRESRQGR